MRKNVTRKQNSKRRNDDLILIIFVAIIIVATSIVGILQNDNRREDKKVEESEKVEINMGIAKAFENYVNSDSNSEDLEASIEANKIVNKKMANPVDETLSETETPTPMEATTEVTTEIVTEVVTEAPTEEPDKSFSEDDLYWLSHVIAAEVGNSTYESKAMCGLVVINRVNSSSFKAETIEEVIFSPGQYETVSNGKIYEEPDDESLEIARKILSGTIEFEIPSDVVYQAEFPQGSGIYCQIGYEYYCFDD